VKGIKTKESYPLYWPEGYKRTELRRSSHFKESSLYETRKDLREEVRRLGGKDLIISTNIRTRADGDIYSSAKEPDDPGVAVFFTLRGKPVSFACDLWKRVWENTWAIAKTIDAMRGIDRWGVSELLDRMFKGFLSLPATIDDPWHAVLEVSPDASIETIRAAYRARTMEVHPDRGGSQEESIRVQQAYERALTARAS
jgi:hypothetical protein